MTQRERESSGTLGDADPHALLFGPDLGDTHDDTNDDLLDDRPRPRPSRSDRHRNDNRSDDNRSHRRNRTWGRISILLVIVLVGVVGYFGYGLIRDYLVTEDYAGNGAGNPVVSVTVHHGDTAATIGTTLHDAGVVKSEQAFVDAASVNGAAQNIQPGTYRVFTKMSAKSAVLALLDPASRDVARDVLITEGATTLDVEDRLSKVLGKDARTEIVTALKRPGAFGLPINYTANGKPPTSLEGFLYPATYTVDPGMSVTDALQRMVTRFVEQDRSSGFADDAKVLGITPYEALTIASIAQAEAKFPQDLARVTRVIYNRMKAGTRLQIDATTLYACQLADAKPCYYNNYASPYNTYLHNGLPPTPIDNPGAEAMAAAVQPAKGDWLYYVNGDAKGHLFFTSSESKFADAVDRCRANNWGCG